MRSDEGKIFRMIFHFGKWSLNDNYQETVKELVNFYNYVRPMIEMPVVTECKIYPIEETEDRADRINWIVNYIEENIKDEVEAKSDYPERYSFECKKRVNKEEPVYELPCPAFFMCNKCLQFRIRPNGPFMTWGYCCGEVIPLEFFKDKFNESEFKYKISRDWVYCTKQITSHSQKGYKIKLNENESGIADFCYEGHKVEEYKC